jgi:hypothetical protein
MIILLHYNLAIKWWHCGKLETWLHQHQPVPRKTTRISSIVHFFNEQATLHSPFTIILINKLFTDIYNFFPSPRVASSSLISRLKSQELSHGVANGFLHSAVVHAKFLNAFRVIDGEMPGVLAWCSHSGLCLAWEVLVDNICYL